MLVAHGGAEHELEQHQAGGGNKEKPETRAVRFSLNGQSPPKFSLAEGNGGNEQEKQLGQRGVKNADAVIQLGDAQAAQHPLDHHGDKSDNTHNAKPFG